MKSKKGFIGFAGALCLALVCLTLSVWLLFTPNSFAGQVAKGVVEISQKDIPLVINSPGSYRLISNLRVPSSDATAISINTDNVTIDLNGFTISGAVKGAREGSCIMDHMSRMVENVVVRGGTVRDCIYGVHVPGWNNRVENLRVYNVGHGIFAGRSSIISECQMAFCFSAINTDDGNLVLNNTIYSNDNIAINTYGGAPSPIGGNTIMGNNIRLSHMGILVRGKGNRIEGNTITQCETGIDLTEGSENYVAKNLLHGNGTALIGHDNDTNGESIDAALSNIILP